MRGRNGVKIYPSAVRRKASPASGPEPAGNAHRPAGQCVASAAVASCACKKALLRAMRAGSPIHCARGRPGFWPEAYAGGMDMWADEMLS